MKRKSRLDFTNIFIATFTIFLLASCKSDEPEVMQYENVCESGKACFNYMVCDDGSDLCKCPEGSFYVITVNENYNLDTCLQAISGVHLKLKNITGNGEYFEKYQFFGLNQFDPVEDSLMNEKQNFVLYSQIGENDQYLNEYIPFQMETELMNYQFAGFNPLFVGVGRDMLTGYEFGAGPHYYIKDSIGEDKLVHVKPIVIYGLDTAIVKLQFANPTASYVGLGSWGGINPIIDSAFLHYGHEDFDN